ncbi:MAG TPA: glycosyltransferase family 87 protein [Kofleriaceae bacterium]|nr:glycosyltransferase family 87 protein [Kofleriaceae bacterium]
MSITPGVPRIVGPSRWILAGSAAVLLVAVVVMARLAGFMWDVERTDLSVRPNDAWRAAHSCVSAYSEAARLAAEPDRNVYRESEYLDRKMSGLKVDTYHYPPPFLLLPGALQRVSGGDLLSLRPVWFALQLALVVAAIVALARWIGGREGGLVLAVGPLFLASPNTLFTLQIGNFQLSALSLGMMAMIAFQSRRIAVQGLGGAALAFTALGKVFPGVLGVYLVMSRRWRAVLWIAAWAAVLVLVTLLVYGTRPFEDFIHYEMPRLSSGDAFPQSERPGMVANNQSIYGLTVKLRTLGLTALDRAAGLSVSSVYGILVLALAGFLAWRTRRGPAQAAAEPTARLASAELWLALLNLASFRSPFVGGAYGVVGTTWLVTLRIAGSTRRWQIAVWGAILAAFMIGGAMMPPPTSPPPIATVWAYTGLHLLMVGVNGWVCWRHARMTR